MTERSHPLAEPPVVGGTALALPLLLMLIDTLPGGE